MPAHEMIVDATHMRKSPDQTWLDSLREQVLSCLTHPYACNLPPQSFQECCLHSELEGPALLNLRATRAIPCCGSTSLASRSRPLRVHSQVAKDRHPSQHDRRMCPIRGECGSNTPVPIFAVGRHAPLKPVSHSTHQLMVAFKLER